MDFNPDFDDENRPTTGDMSGWALWLVVLPVLLGVILYARHSFSSRGYRRLPTGPKRQRSSFLENVEQGLTSDTFDVRANVSDPTEVRPGLDSDEVQRIMKRYHCSFDQARLIQVQERMRANGVDPQTGLPLDSKAVMFRS